MFEDQTIFNEFILIFYSNHSWDSHFQESKSLRCLVPQFSTETLEGDIDAG